MRKFIFCHIRYFSLIILLMNDFFNFDTVCVMNSAMLDRLVADFMGSFYEKMGHSEIAEKSRNYILRALLKKGGLTNSPYNCTFP